MYESNNIHRVNVCVCVCVVCVKFRHQLALDHPQEERRHSRAPLTPSAPLRQLPSQLKDHLHLRIHHGKKCEANVPQSITIAMHFTRMCVWGHGWYV